MAFKSPEACRASENPIGLHGTFLEIWELHMWPFQTEKRAPAGLLLALMLSVTKADGFVLRLQAFLVTSPPPLHHSFHIQKICVVAISPPPGFLLPFRLQAYFCQGAANYWSVHHCWLALNGTQQSKRETFKGTKQTAKKKEGEGESMWLFFPLR